MKRIISAIAAVALSGAASVAIAQDQVKQSTQKPVAMSDAQLEKVAAGALVDIVVVDAVDVNRNQVIVAVPANVNAAIAILGEVAQTSTQTQAGRIGQRR
jgi:sulfate adenylyltransferase subunit 1 (EFTu-like GTPase family)